MGSGASAHQPTEDDRQPGTTGASRPQSINSRGLHFLPHSTREHREHSAPLPFNRQSTAASEQSHSQSRFPRITLPDRSQQQRNNLINVLRSNGRGVTHIVCHQCRSIHWTLSANPETCRLCGSAFIEVFDAASAGMMNAGLRSGNPDDHLLQMAYLAGMREMHPLMGLYGQSIEERVMAESFNTQPYIAHPAPKEVIAMLLPLRYDKYVSESKEELDEDKKECAICREDFTDMDLITELPKCTHIFHQDCCIQWLELQSTCPICRNVMTELSIFFKGNTGASEGKDDGFEEDAANKLIQEHVVNRPSYAMHRLAEDCVSVAVETALISVTQSEVVDFNA